MASTVHVLSLSRFVRIFRKIVSVVCLMSGFCPDVLSGVCVSGFCLSRFCQLSGFCPDFEKKKLSAVYPSGRTRTRQSCPDFHCSCPPMSDCYYPPWWIFVAMLSVSLLTLTTIHSSGKHPQDFWNFRHADLESLASSYSYHVFMNTVYLLSTVNGYSFYLISKICISYAQ